MDKQKQIEEMAKIIFEKAFENYETSGSVEIDTEVRRNCYSAFLLYCEAFYNAGYRKIPENAVVLTMEEYDELQKGVKTHNYTAMFEAQDAYRWEQGYFQGCKETAEKFARLVEFHSVSTRDNDGREIFTISALGLKEILHEEFGIPYDEICKEFTGEKND